MCGYVQVVQQLERQNFLTERVLKKVSDDSPQTLDPETVAAMDRSSQTLIQQGYIVRSRDPEVGE